MPAPVELVSVIVGFGLITLAGARLGAGSHLSLIGLFARPVVDEWPHGVQEGDVPRFAVEHADGLRHPPAPVSPFEELSRAASHSVAPTLVDIEVHRARSTD